MKLFLIKFFFIFFSVLTLASEKIKRRGKKNDVSGFKFFEKNKIGNKEILFEGFFTLVETTNNKQKVDIYKKLEKQYEREKQNKLRGKKKIVYLNKNEILLNRTKKTLTKNNNLIEKIKRKQENLKIPNKFYFRLTKDYLFYSKTQRDPILASIPVGLIQSQSSKCIKIISKLNHQKQWTICSDTIESKKKIECSILKIMKKPCNETPIKNIKIPRNITYITKTQSLTKKHFLTHSPLVIIYNNPKCTNLNWNYLYHGRDWACSCKSNNFQSPISLYNESINYPSLKLINNPSKFEFISVKLKDLIALRENNILKIKCDENICDSNIFSFGMIQDAELNQFIAQEIHFHCPAEHMINNKKYDLEIQIFYKSIKKNKNNVILSILGEETKGFKNIFFENLNIISLPINENEQKNLYNFDDDINLNLEDLFKKDDNDKNCSLFNYYSYEGSINIPNCTETIKWYVSEKIIQIGMADLEMLRNSMKIKQLDEMVFIGNNREVQDNNNRIIEYFNTNYSLCQQTQINDMKNNEELKENYQNSDISPSKNEENLDFYLNTLKNMN